MTKETLEAMEACEPQANLYMAAEEYAEEQAYDFKGFSDVEDYIELAELMKQAVVYGAHWKEQQMMKSAMEGEIIKISPNDHLRVVSDVLPLKDESEWGTRVKLIMIKQEED